MASLTQTHNLTRAGGRACSPDQSTHLPLVSTRYAWPSNQLISVLVGAKLPHRREASGELSFRAGSILYSKRGAGLLTPESLSYYALHLMNHGRLLLYALWFVGLMIRRGNGFVRRPRQAHRPGSRSNDAGRQCGCLWAGLLAR
jgi:hypothetical protein